MDQTWSRIQIKKFLFLSMFNSIYLFLLNCNILHQKLELYVLSFLANWAEEQLVEEQILGEWESLLIGHFNKLKIFLAVNKI